MVWCVCVCMSACVWKSLTALCGSQGGEVLMRRIMGARGGDWQRQRPGAERIAHHRLLGHMRIRSCRQGYGGDRGNTLDSSTPDTGAESCA